MNVWQTVDDIEADHIRNKEPQKAFSPDDPQENDGNINENTINRDSQEDTEIEPSEEVFFNIFILKSLDYTSLITNYEC